MSVLTTIWDPNSPTFDTFYEEGRSTAIKYMCIFIASEIETVSMMVINHFNITWNIDRERKKTLLEKESFHVFLCAGDRPTVGLYGKIFQTSSCRLEHQYQHLCMESSWKGLPNAEICLVSEVMHGLSKMLTLLALQVTSLFWNPTTFLELLRRVENTPTISTSFTNTM